MKARINLIYFILFIAVFLGITTLSLLPPRHVEIGEHDKLGHFIAYATLLLSFALWQPSSKKIAIGFIFFIVYGIFMEWLQGFVPGRVPSMEDIYANIGGLVIGLICLLVFGKIFSAYLFNK